MTTSVFWDCLSGQRHTFELWALGSTEFLSIPGVYVMTKLIQQNGAGFYTPIYVGETKSFYQRLNARSEDHEGYERALRLGATHVGVMHVVHRTDRLRIETDMRHSHNPPANAQSVPSLADILSGKV
jgi:excinuclease UvrABC nuclease subunit